MRVRARAVFAESLRNAHRWLDDLIMDPNQTIALIAAKEGKSERSIRMTLSLAFIAPPSSSRRSRDVCHAGSELSD
jgi:site-specific DNA recombinase